MSRLVPDLAFQNVVHEEMVPRLMPCKYFDAYVNHYGYIYGSGSGNTDKQSRNLPLLLQNIKERPSYVKNYLQITQEYTIVEDWEKAEVYCREGLRLCKKYEDDFYRGWLQVNLLSILCRTNNFEKAEQEALRILEKEPPRELIRLDIYETLLAIYTRRKATEETLRYGKLFEEILSYMEQHPELWRQQTYADITEERIKLPDRLYQIRINCTEAALKSNDTAQAVRFFRLLPWEDESWMQRYYPVFDNWKEFYPKHFPELLKHIPEHSPYMLLQRATGQNCESEINKCQNYFVQCVEKTESVYLRYQAVREAVLHGVNLKAIVSIMDLDTWKQCVKKFKDWNTCEEKEKLKNAVEKLILDVPLYGLWR